MKRPNPKVVRRALGLSQEQFADVFGIPIGTLRDWEQGRAEPDQAARSYLQVNAHDPEIVRQALKAPASRRRTRNPVSAQLDHSFAAPYSTPNVMPA